MTAFWGFVWSLNYKVSLLLAGPGISGYSHAPEKAGPSLEQCLQQAKEVIPSAQHKETPVYLGATAGMRLLRYCRACPPLLQHCTWDRHGCAAGAPGEQASDTLLAHTVPRYAPLLLTPLSPESPGPFHCFPIHPNSPSSPASTCSTETPGDQQCPDIPIIKG